MRPADLKTLIAARLSAKILRPIHIEGAPGLGKTEIAAQVAASQGPDFGFLVIHAPLLAPEDYGFPVISADRSDVSFIVSKSRFPVEGSSHPARGLLLIDELAQADASAQKVLRNLIQAREIHGQRLLPGWTIITTGNRAADRAGAFRLLSHMSNVLTRITLDASLPDWTEWALSANVRPEVIAFLNFRPELLSTFDPNSEINATPRSWTQGVSAALGTIPAALELPTFSGDVGEGPAAEFIAFLRIYRNLPSIAEILKTPLTAPVPTAPNVLYALSGALTHHATPENFSALMSYVARIPAEFQVLLLTTLVKKLPSIQNTPPFITWATTTGKTVLL